jgi:hypothetical protein
MSDRQSRWKKFPCPPFHDRYWKERLTQQGTQDLTIRAVKLECGMGRQTAVALSEEDEGRFLQFLRADADIQIFRWAASSPELLVVSSFPSRGGRR